MKTILLIICFLLLFNVGCSAKKINYDYQIVRIRQDYSPQLYKQGWKEANNNDQSSIIYYNDKYKSYISIYIEEFVNNKEDLDWQVLTDTVLKQLGEATKLKFTVKNQQRDINNKKQLLLIDAKGERPQSPDFRIRLYWLVSNNILYKIIGIGPEHYWPKALFDFVGLVDYFTKNISE